MDLEDLKQQLTALRFGDDRIQLLAGYDTEHGPLEIHLTDRLQNRCRREKKWRSRGLLLALASAEAGFVPGEVRPGNTGLFQLDRTHSTANRMNQKVFERFLDRPDTLVPVIEQAFESPKSTWTAVRLVSEPIRLLGFYLEGEPNRLVLVDLDITR